MNHSRLNTVVLLSVIIFLAARQSFAASRKFPFYGRIIGVNVNVRARPSTNAEVVYQFETDPEALIVTGSSKGSGGTWYSIRAVVPMLNENDEEYEAEISGWVFGKYVAYERNYDGAYD
ncbi:MAG: SH3 domain-containing protein [Synergistaceae bacterium]|nr:SH3 domain-containing protein [Synergistaceae bacterium]MBQ7168819.1 SH3 domain-containing protein [Synergistaceae bacterium]